MQQIYLLLLLILATHLSQAKVHHVIAMISQGARYPANDIYDGE